MGRKRWTCEFGEERSHRHGCYESETHLMKRDVAKISERNIVGERPRGIPMTIMFQRHRSANGFHTNKRSIHRVMEKFGRGNDLSPLETDDGVALVDLLSYCTEPY